MLKRKVYFDLKSYDKVDKNTIPKSGEDVDNFISKILRILEFCLNQLSTISGKLVMNSKTKNGFVSAGGGRPIKYGVLITTAILDGRHRQPVM